MPDADPSADDKLKLKFFEVEKRLVSLEGMEDRVREVEDLQMLSQLELMKLKDRPAPAAAQAGVPAALPKDLDKRLAELMHRLEAVEAQKVTDKSVSQFIERMVTEKKSLEDDMERFLSVKREFEAMLRDKEEITKSAQLSEVNMEKLDALYARMKATEEKVHVDVDKIGGMLRRMQERHDDSMAKNAALKKSLEGRVALAEDKFRIRTEKMDSLKDSLNTKLAMVEDKIRELDHMRKTWGSAEKLRSALDEEAVQRIALEKNVQELHKKVEELDEGGSTGLRKQLDDEYITITAHEKRMADFARRLDTIDAKFRAGASKREAPATAAALPALPDDRIAELEARYNELRSMMDVKSLAPDEALAEARARFEGEVEQKLQFFSQKVDELGMKIQLEKEQLTKSLNMEELMKIRDEILAQKKMMHDIEKHLEMSAVRFFTDNLEEFAKHIDKKMPQFVTREEFERALKQRPQAAAAAPAQASSELTQRLYAVERKISDIHSTLRVSTGGGQPIVIE